MSTDNTEKGAGNMESAVRIEKEIFSIKELVAIGYSKTDLTYDVHAKGQRFATKTANGGKWLINRAAYDKFRERRRT